MGTPYEGKQVLNDISGFATKEGEVLPNDDLDLQLVWLKAIEEQGPNGINEKILGEYWLSFIMPNWNEYGVGKSNMRDGFLPPMSGEVNNTMWKNSNGAWIRTEIWACLFPGNPEKAIRYSYYDACVDHGFGEGTYAAIFIEAIESAAFVINDINTLLRLGLSKIPDSCRVARSVKIVMDEYSRGTDWKTVREMLISDSSDLGWFQAPANIGFTVLGLLYGEGDFKKSMILAINCGDDTDCTGATLGSIMGIAYGTDIIPKDWSAHLGDAIVQKCCLNGHGRYPESCTELTDCVMSLLPVTLHIPFFRTPDYGTIDVVVHEGDNDFCGLEQSEYFGTAFVDSVFNCSPYTFTMGNVFCDVKLELFGAPRIAPFGTLRGRVTITNKIMPEQKHYHLRWFTAGDWKVEGSMNLHAHTPGYDPEMTCRGEFTITAGEFTDPTNRLVLEVATPGRPTPVYLPVTIMG